MCLPPKKDAEENPDDSLTTDEVWDAEWTELLEDKPQPGLIHKVAHKFKKVDAAGYWFKFLLKFPERFVTGVIASVVTYILITLLGVI